MSNSLTENFISNFNNISIIQFLVELTNLFSSNSEAKRAIKNNAISINENKIKDINYKLNYERDLIRDEWIVVDLSKHDRHIVRIVE